MNVAGSSGAGGVMATFAAVAPHLIELALDARHFVLGTACCPLD
jgi:hypothetical protein